MVHRAIGAMGEINASSRKISDIISVIDEMMQTLLGLI